MSRASDRAYEAIRSMILSGELPAGSQLGEEALAEKCGVSRTPVREALRRLESDLLVTRTDTQRSFVADWSIDDVADAFELRAMLEGKAARRAAERMTDDALDRIRAANRQIDGALSKPGGDVAGFLEGNREFHTVILEVAGSRRLAALLGTLIEQPVVWRTAHHYGRDALRRSHGEHEELIAAFARRDGAWAEAIMVGHILRAYHAYADAHRGLTDTAMQLEAAE
ncbi:GntR family transcriptional regulator [Novosphingobium sp. KCTC 2891]|uniref:GntR family transcriptional regulator n=1 Tax=Novosphingobium sp. KCTC 2891 TaxID=2989730 RepID=UPI0022239DE7|nr:GntR family transcriptional regulator [Novosphingobium sp. KCTC 2891]MCW1384967.1 GntR family transcriptional regulator [Novosphingobium sp. KCTC 2891]